MESGHGDKKKDEPAKEPESGVDTSSPTPSSQSASDSSLDSPSSPTPSSPSTSDSSFDSDKKSEARFTPENLSDYTFIRPLQGRGQAGAAGFYEIDGRFYLIKEDDPATCTLESAASFAIPFLPDEHKSVINLAQCKTFIGDKEKIMVTSIQPAVQNAKPWDIVIFGEKRNPRRPVSKEYMDENTLLSHISRLNPKLKADLAVAVYASTLAGDESLHTGQFMAIYPETDKKQLGPIIGLVRIDLGARERYALRRHIDNDFKNKTSEAYASSGQWGKNYMDFYLKDPDVDAKYTQLCIHMLPEPTHKIGKESVASFDAAISQIPPHLKQAALWEIYRKTYVKGCTAAEKQAFITKLGIKEITKKTDADIIEKAIKEIIALVVENRIQRMRIHALESVDDLLKKFEQLVITRTDAKLEISICTKDLMSIIHAPLFDENDMRKIPSIIAQIALLCSEASPEELKICNTVLSHVYASVEFLPSISPHKRITLALIQLLQDSVKFKTYLLKNKSEYLGLFLNAGEKTNTDMILSILDSLLKEIATKQPGIINPKHLNTLLDKIITLPDELLKSSYGKNVASLMMALEESAAIFIHEQGSSKEKTTPKHWG